MEHPRGESLRRHEVDAEEQGGAGDEGLREGDVEGRGLF